jgi:methanogenic corrinoid protein MtbC1
MIDAILPPDILAVFIRYPSLAKELELNSPWFSAPVEAGIGRPSIQQLIDKVLIEEPIRKYVKLASCIAWYTRQTSHREKLISWLETSEEEKLFNWTVQLITHSLLENPEKIKEIYHKVKDFSQEKEFNLEQRFFKIIATLVYAEEKQEEQDPLALWEEMEEFLQEPSIWLEHQLEAGFACWKLAQIAREKGEEEFASELVSKGYSYGRNSKSRFLIRLFAREAAKFSNVNLMKHLQETFAEIMPSEEGIEKLVGEKKIKGLDTSLAQATKVLSNLFAYKEKDTEKTSDKPFKAAVSDAFSEALEASSANIAEMVNQILSATQKTITQKLSSLKEKLKESRTENNLLGITTAIVDISRTYTNRYGEESNPSDLKKSESYLEDLEILSKELNEPKLEAVKYLIRAERAFERKDKEAGKEELTKVYKMELSPEIKIRINELQDLQKLHDLHYLHDQDERNKLDVQEKIEVEKVDEEKINQTIAKIKDVVTTTMVAFKEITPTFQKAEFKGVIILSTDGIPIYQLLEKSIEADPMLTSGLISALSNFAGEAFNVEGSLESINYQGLAILIETREKALYVLLTVEETFLARQKLRELTHEIMKDERIMRVINEPHEVLIADEEYMGGKIKEQIVNLWAHDQTFLN